MTRPSSLSSLESSTEQAGSVLASAQNQRCTRPRSGSSPLEIGAAARQVESVEEWAGIEGGGPRKIAGSEGFLELGDVTGDRPVELEGGRAGHAVAAGLPPQDIEVLGKSMAGLLFARVGPHEPEDLFASDPVPAGRGNQGQQGQPSGADR